MKSASSKSLLVAVIAIGCTPAPAWQAGPNGFSPEAIQFFESKVRPILATKCQICHNEKTRTSGLSLETRASLLAGGNRGAVVDTNSPAKSVFLTAITQSGDLKMPPTGKLKAEEIADLENWIKIGLPWPEKTAKATRSGADHWSFKPVTRPEPPPASKTAWTRNPIDQFIVRKLAEKNLKPSPEAGRRTLLRRVSLDLTGLPPTLEQMSAFLADTAPDAYERAVDGLLASPHYGERWARHWLDIARYADTDGYTIDAPRDIWKYRDWVINAINRDLPFDQFTIDQMAGDLLPNPTQDQLIATGFHRNTPSNFEGGIDFEQYRVEAVVDRVSTTGAAFLGLTLGCARCHDHKYDPVSQREFYQIYAFLNSVDEVDDEKNRKNFNQPMLELPTPEESARRAAWTAQRDALNAELAAYEKSITGDRDQARTGPAQPSLSGGDPASPAASDSVVRASFSEDPGWKERKANLAALQRRMPKVTSTMVMRELPKPRESYIHLGGDFIRKGAPVSPGVPAFLPPLSESQKADRLGFARWLVDRRNPLTSRVTVNRMWQRYFGKGLVDTENDFGTQGDNPTHPELLDWLASEFMDRAWSQKAIHRLIVTSATYRQSSRNRSDAAAIDPDNRLLARQTRLRLDAEIIRDSALLSSGLLARAVGGPGVYPPIPAGATSVTQVDRVWKTSTGPDRYRRGMYTFFQRSAGHPALIVFDAPDGASAVTRRVRSNTPLQALTTLNDQAFIEFSRTLAERVSKEAGPSPDERMNRLFLLTLGRQPTVEESQRMKRFLSLRLDEFQSDPESAKTLAADVAATGNESGNTAQVAAWASVARVVLNLDEFLTRE
ncbi:MAG: PSD1 domain-containing protein [Acidobacteriia bacterium]|nr:PSD1 domain-containing protein [Terriglobia bacterium]